MGRFKPRPITGANETADLQKQHRQRGAAPRQITDDEIVDRGRQALASIKKTRLYDDWMAAGEAAAVALHVWDTVASDAGVEVTK